MPTFIELAPLVLCQGNRSHGSASLNPPPSPLSPVVVMQTQSSLLTQKVGRWRSRKGERVWRRTEGRKRRKRRRRMCRMEKGRRMPAPI